MALMKFYLDADISQKVAQVMRRLEPDIDVTSAQELGHFRVLDLDELAHAADEDRCIVTRNYKDFVPLARRFAASGRVHAGIVFVPIVAE